MRETAEQAYRLWLIYHDHTGYGIQELPLILCCRSTVSLYILGSREFSVQAHVVASIQAKVS